MPYFPKARFTETVDYIRGYAACGLSLALRADIATYVAAKFPRLTPANIQAFDALATEMSVKGSLGAGVARGTEDQRQQRRALVLLWRAMGVTLPVPADVGPKVQLAMNLAPGALAAELDETMLKAAVAASGAGAAHVFNMHFVTNPLGFITTRRIFIYGTTQGVEKVMNPAAASFENNLPFHFQYQANFDRFCFARLADAQYGASHTVTAVSVVALHWSDVPGRGLVPLPTAAAPSSFAGMLAVRFSGGPTLMLTTQFTGCAFCFRSVGGTFHAAHISPSGDVNKPVLTGQVLANQIMGNVANVAAGAFANIPAGAGAGALNVFGNGAGNVHPFGGGNAFYPPKTPNAGPGQMKWMSIFGRLNGAWELYTQSVDGAGAIMEARRIL